jgi:tetratricopeptide (TPR) repeat protein
MNDTSGQPGSGELQARFDRERDPAEKYAAGLALADALSNQGKRDQAIAVLNQVKSLARDDHAEATALIRLADACSKKSDYEGAVGNLEDAVVKLSAAPDSLELLDVYLQIATIYWRQGYIERTRSFLDGALLVMQLRQGRTGPEQDRARADLLHVQAIVEGSTGNQEGAIRHYREEIGLLEALGDRAKLGAAYNNLSGLNKAQGRLAAALEHQLKAMDIAEQVGEPLAIAISCNNLGEIYFELGCQDKALPYYRLYMDLNKKIANRIGDAFGNAGLARIYQERGEFQKAEQFFLDALAIAREVKSGGREANVLSDLAELYCDWARPDKATAALDEAIRISIDLQLFNTQHHQVLAARILCLESLSWLGRERYARQAQARTILEGVLKGPIVLEYEDAGSAVDLELECHLLLAAIHRAQGRAVEAAGHDEQAIELANTFAAQFPDDIRKTYLSRGRVRAINKLRDEIAAGTGANNSKPKQDENHGRQ